MMNAIYLGKYKNRFENITKLIDPTTTSVIELCFGDTYIAAYCRKRGIKWVGYDLNERFVKNALKQNYAAIHDDVGQLDELPKCDTYIMIGSLYHFQKQGVDLLNKMILSSNKVIISEPIRNFSSSKGLIGFIARRSANAGKGHEVFRYNEKTFMNLIKELNRKYKVISIDKDILIEIYND